MPNPVPESMALIRDGRTPRVIIARWHDENHPGGFGVCDRQPCHAINYADRRPPHYA